MCLLRTKAATPKGEPTHEYGILLHNMTETMSYGTCHMHDGRDVTLSWDKLHQSFKRIKESDYIIPPEKQKECWDMYVAACADTEALAIRIERSVKAYVDDMDSKRNKREAVRVAAATLKSKTKPTKRAPKKAKISEIRVKTHVSMFFTWEELESTLPRPTNVPDADGMTDMADQWRTGTVTKIWQNKWKKKVYTCVFDTPGKFTSPYNAKEILVARDNYLKLNTPGLGSGDSSSDDFSPSDEESNMPPSANAATTQMSSVEHSRLKGGGHHLVIPETQPEGDNQLDNHNGTKMKTADVFIESLFDRGALNLLVVLGLRLDLSCIVARNSVQHCNPLGPLDRYALAHVVLFLGTGLSAKEINLRTEMLENGVNLAVRRHHLRNVKGTPF